MKRSIIFICLSFVCLTAVSIASSPAEQSKPGRTFHSSRQAGQIDIVKVQFKVGGEIIDVVNGKQQREKMSVDCHLDYEEKTSEVAADPKQFSRAVRYYNQAEAAIKIGPAEFKPVLTPEHTLIAAEITPQAVLLFSPRAGMTREELDLIDVPGDSLLLDRFLPDETLAVGDAWKHSEKLMAQFLGLDEVGQTDVQSTLKEVTDKVARFEMAGKVEGAVNGVTTAIEIKARYRFDRKRGRLDWLGMLIKEKRQSSPVSDGVEAVAQLQMTIFPAEKTEHLNEADLKDLPLQATPELLRLSHLSKAGPGAWEISYDRDWHLYRDLQDSAVLRRVERGELIAQCNLSSLGRQKPDKLVSREDFQEDIKRALDKNFREFVEAGQSRDEFDRRVLRVVARGAEADLPIRWIYYHLADKQGRQMSFVFTMEEKYAERFGQADRELLGSLRFVDSEAEKKSVAQKPAEEGKETAERH
jgi:hypothetical protein